MYGAKISLPRLAILTLLFLVLTTPSLATAQYCTRDQCDECNLCRCSQRCCHELPELWLINTRCAPRCQNLDSGFDCISYKRYDRQCCRWVQESLESFLAQEATMPTLFYSHGNSLNHKNAMKSCWMVYKKMRCCPGSKRLVFWSWPAERVYKTEGLRVRKMIEKNLRVKYVYAEYQGYYMAKLVNQMSLSQRVMMSGHSYGGITTAAAMHYLGGGCLRGLTFAGGAAVERPNLRTAVISGAFDHDMLNPGHRYGQAFVAAEKIFVTRNINDRTLKKWPKTSWRGRRAIGVLGVNANCLGEHRSKLCQQTMSSDVGTSHYLKPHLKSVRFVSALCCLSFPDCQQGSLANTENSSEPEILSEELSNEQLAIEAEFVLGSNDLDLPFDDDTAEGSSGNATELANFSLLATNDLTASDLSEVLGSECLGNRENAGGLLMPEPKLFQPLASRRSTDRKSPTSTTESETPRPKQDEPRQLQLAGHAGSGQQSLAYRVGLGLALVLSGQFYVLLSKRVAAS